MVIRTQNKKRIVNFDRVDTICTKTIRKKGEIKEQYETLIMYYCGNEETMGELGRYSTEEKAIEVLDDIFASFRNMAFVDVVTFQMPQDSGV